MTTLYLIRHGITEANLNHLMQGSTDQELCPQGKEQLPYLTEHFKKIELDAIYCSDTKRARQTAQAVAGTRGLELVESKKLRERDGGIYEGYPVKELVKMAGIQNNGGGPRFPIQFVLPTAEPVPDVYQRVKEQLEEIVQVCKGKRVAVVSHGMAIQMAFSYLLQIDLKEYEGRPINNLSVSKAVIDENNCVEFEYFNDLSFLPEEMLEGNKTIGRK